MSEAQQNISSLPLSGLGLESISESRLLSIITAAVVTVCFGVGAWFQHQVHLNHDVGWIVHTAGWMLEGRRFGSDIVDVNPPLIWFLSMPAALIVRLGWLAEPEAIRICVWTLCLGSVALCYRLLAPMRKQGRPADAAALIVGVAFSCAVLAGKCFGQREFISFIAAMPYCLAVAGRIELDVKYSHRSMVVCGLLAGVAFGFKPWLLSVPIILELVYLAHTRSLRRVLRVETVTVALFLVSYVLLALILTPDYFTVTVPLAMAVYWIYGRTEIGVLSSYFAATLGSLLICAVVMVAVTRRVDGYVRVLAAALVGYSINYWMQGKGFDYHLYPALAVCVTLVVYLAVQTCREIMLARWLRASVGIRWAIVATFLIVLTMHLLEPIQQVRYWLIRESATSGWLWNLREGVIRRVTQLSEGRSPRIYAFSTHPYPAFPTMSYVKGEWTGRQIAQFAIAGHIRLPLIKDPERRRRMEEGVAMQRAMVLEEFLENKPDIVLINTVAPKVLDERFPQFDYIEYLSTDPRFAALWTQYVEVKGSNEIRIFVREDWNRQP
jgi:hypothetical protein